MRIHFTIFLLLAVCGPAMWLNSVTAVANDETKFGEPELIKVGDEPMNADGKIMYPSPAVFDVDNDGKNELVLGSIFGGLYVCENENESGDPSWTAPKPLKDAKGEAIRLNNW